METMAYLPDLEAVSLVILENGVIKCFDFTMQSRWTIGRTTPENRPDISLTSPIAGRKHGEFVFVSGQWFYCDRGSLNGTFYNGTKIETGLNGRVCPVMLKDGDVLRIDNDDLNMPDPSSVWILFSRTRAQREWRYVSLDDKDITTIGRSVQCDIVQPLPYISACHTKIMRLNGIYYISDNDSAAGTWLNGKRIQKAMILKEKDCISICDCHFVFTGNGVIYDERKNMQQKADNLGNILLSANIRSKTVYNQDGGGLKELIRDIQLTIYSGKLIALLGGSGAGKSTLMRCLNGTDQKGVNGNVTFQGEDLYKNFGRLKHFIGSVPQENVLHELLTVEDELTNAAVLRLPGDTCREEIKKYVNDTLSSLNLEAKRHTQIKKLSGGEKKRVNIGIELVADKNLLCLDEPDAGLDPMTKKELFITLRKLVQNRGKTILVIIHDVSEIDLFDQIILMIKYDNVGRLAYFGTPEEARTHFNIDNFSEIYNVIDQNPERYII